MVDEFGAELLSQPTQIIAFVAHALDADADAATTPSFQEEAVDPKLSKLGLNLDDLNIVDDDDQDERHEDDEETLLPGSGVDEIMMTAVTLLLAVLESEFIRPVFIPTDR
jgi:hypothetical protein